MSRTQWQESLSLAERAPAMGSHDFVPTHLPGLANNNHLEPYSFTNHIPSNLEGMWGIVDRKAGSLADARHSPLGH